MRKVVILAAHDDGVGAHTTMCRIRDGIVSAIQDQSRRQESYFFLYLNGGAAGKDFLRSYWDHGAPSEWTITTTHVDPREQGSNVKGVWHQASNLLQFVKADDGSLDAPETRKALPETIRGFETWAHNLYQVEPTDVKLAIEMGVPQLSAWASKDREINIPCIAVGDTFWSRTLQGSLKWAGEYDHQTEELVHKLAGCERETNEAWLLPLLSPRSYADFLAEMRVIYHYLPGFIGQPPDSAEVEKCKNDLALDADQKLIVMASGQTEVWKSIYEKLAIEFERRSDKGIALAYPEKNEITIVEKGKRRKIPNPSNLAALFANAHLGVTRGGVTITEFISVKLPFAVIQEPNHWLSQHQQAAASEEGLCYTAGLSILKEPEEAVDLLISWVNDTSNNEAIRQRCAMYDFGVERKLGEHLVKRFLLA
jgi:hypothetical protein